MKLKNLEGVKEFPEWVWKAADFVDCVPSGRLPLFIEPARSALRKTYGLACFLFFLVYRYTSEFLKNTNTRSHVISLSNDLGVSRSRVARHRRTAGATYPIFCSSSAGILKSLHTRQQIPVPILDIEIQMDQPTQSFNPSMEQTHLAWPVSSITVEQGKMLSTFSVPYSLTCSNVPSQLSFFYTHTKSPNASSLSL